MPGEYSYFLAVPVAEDSQNFSRDIFHDFVVENLGEGSENYGKVFGGKLPAGRWSEKKYVPEPARPDPMTRPVMILAGDHINNVQ